MRETGLACLLTNWVSGVRCFELPEKEDCGRDEEGCGKDQAKQKQRDEVKATRPSNRTESVAQRKVPKTLLLQTKRFWGRYFVEFKKITKTGVRSLISGG